MNTEQLRKYVLKRRENGDSYEKIGNDLGLSKPTVSRIEKGEKIGKSIEQSLKLDPSPKLINTRHRREMLDKIAVYWKYESWSNYETITLKDFEENFNWETGVWKDE